MKCRYGDVWGPIHGKEGDTPHSIDLESGEMVTGVSGAAGRLLDRITIYTNLRQYGPYGGNGGTSFASAGEVLGYISGRANNAVDAITIHYGSACKC